MVDNNNPKLKKNGGDGTKVGNALRWLVKQGKVIAPEILDAAGKITGIESLNNLSDLIANDKQLTELDKELLLAELQQDVIEMQEVTKRWGYDMASDSWLSKNIRPLVVANFTILIDFVIISSQFGKPLGEAYLPILMTMGVTAIGGYFSLREYGKSKKMELL